MNPIKMLISSRSLSNCSKHLCILQTYIFPKHLNFNSSHLLMNLIHHHYLLPLQKHFLLLISAILLIYLAG